jgi:hypothetical protein
VTIAMLLVMVGIYLLNRRGAAWIQRHIDRLKEQS